ncbi:DUF881 domain-containing protein [Nakamurella flava]|uniref:DUF881 domain-containing protein n=1 Tax=Nakamurella flava TaxID=2576308 RepID=UPI001F100EF7|nr:DUF881 domain-containing protein [Nakamurella flava]
MGAPTDVPGPDPGAAPGEPASPAPRRRPPRPAGPGIKVVVAVLCALLGFALVLQVRRTASGDTLATARPDDLVQILDGLQRREDELNGEIGDLRDTLTRLRSSGASSAEALSEAQRQAAALGILTGTVPAAGPGVRIVIDDPNGTVPPEVLLDAIQELRNAGGEAFQVGSVRIGVNSAFTGGRGAITLDGIALQSPYTVLAIGDPPTLTAALSIAGGVLDTVRRAGGTMEVTQSDDVRIDAVRAVLTPQYAQPTTG